MPPFSLGLVAGTADALAMERSRTMTKKATKLRRPPGPEPEVLKIEGDWKDAMRKLISKKRPVGGWPKPEKTKAK
jgi:hypothetical protein